MGLDVSFNMAPAIDAGLETKIAVESGYKDTEEGIDEPERVMHLIRLEGHAYWRDADMQIVDGLVRCMVRANKWGSLYKPLTDFLLKHNIDWIET